MTDRREGIGCIPCSADFSESMPTKEGGYYMRCMENGQKPEWVAVYRKGGVLRAALDLGDYPLEMIHSGLTDVSWRHAISAKPNTTIGKSARTS